MDRTQTIRSSSIVATKKNSPVVKRVRICAGYAVQNSKINHAQTLRIHKMKNKIKNRCSAGA